MLDIRYTRHFAREFKKLSKHFQGMGDELDVFLRSVQLTHRQAIGHSCYKIRYSPSTSSKGKSGGLRIIVLAIQMRGFLVPVTIYEKSKTESISKSELLAHLKAIHLEL